MHTRSIHWEVRDSRFYNTVVYEYQSFAIAEKRQGLPIQRDMRTAYRSAMALSNSLGIHLYDPTDNPRSTNETFFLVCVHVCISTIRPFIVWMHFVLLWCKRTSLLLRFIWYDKSDPYKTNEIAIERSNSSWIVGCNIRGSSSSHGRLSKIQRSLICSYWKKNCAN